MLYRPVDVGLHITHLHSYNTRVDVLEHISDKCASDDITQ